MSASVSVVIPLHQAAATIGDTLHALRAQTLQPTEVVVVDDRSTDDGPAIAAAALDGAGFPARFLASDAGNAARTRNLGAFAATGDRMLFLDADDVLGPEALAGMSEALDAAPAAGLALCRWLRLELQGEVWRSAPASCPPRRAGESLLSAWLRGWYHPPCAALWGRDAYLHTGGWDPLATVMDDGDLVMRHLLRRGDAGVAFAQRGVAFYRRAAGKAVTLSGRRGSSMGLASRLHVFEKIGHRLEESGRLEAHRDALMTALHRVAIDAGDTPAAEQAAALSRRFRGPLGSRIRCKLSRAPSPAPPAPDPHGGSADREPPGPFQPTVRGSTPAPAPERLDLPDVSVVIPVFNRPADAVRAIRSVLDQPAVSLELLVVDDASTDGTRDAVGAVDDPRLRLLRQPENTGVAAARNRGMRESRGRVVAWLDSDDHWLPGTLAPRLAALDAAPAGTVLLVGGVERSDGEATHRHTPPAVPGLLPGLFLENDLLGAASNGLLRREALAVAGFFDEELSAVEDWELWIRLAKQASFVGFAAPCSAYADDPTGPGRRSRARAANLAAREQLYGRHGPAMLQADRGVAAAFLLETARRHLARTPADADAPDADSARRLTRRAWAIRPLSLAAPRLLRWARSIGRGPR